MSKLGIFMADGCEEIEGLTVVDLVRRAGIEIEMISVSGEKNVTGSHKIAFQTDVSKADADFASYDGIVLPGGMPGTTHLMEDETVNRVIKEFAQDGKLVAAICAAPSVLGNAGLLEGKTATCYPGVEGKLTGANFVTNSVAKDGNIITSRGLGTAIDFAAEIVAYLNGKIVADKLKTSIIYRL
jgi:protein deglycase